MNPKSFILSLCFIVVVAMNLSSCIEGSIFDFSDYSAIYVSNNTSDSLFVEINTSESRSLWSVAAQEIKPYHTERVLTLKRNAGLPKGTVLSYSTAITNASGEGVNLLQDVISNNLSDDIRFAIEADDVVPIFQDNNDLYHYNSHFNSHFSRAMLLSFKGKSKTLFKDVYYSISEPALDQVQNNDENELLIATYNVWGLPLVSSDISTRFSLIPDYLINYDVLMLQEVFDASRTSMLARLAAEYPYQTSVLSTGGNNLYDGGVVIVSRFPIINEAEYVFPDCSGSDCFADKGVKYAEVVKGGESYHIFATHTASFDSDSARENRRKQFAQIRDFATSLSIPSTDQVIYGGDLNVNKLKFPGDYADMFSLLQADEPLYSGYTKATFDPDINLQSRDLASGGDHPEYIDYILISHEFGSYQENTNEVFIPRHDHEKLWQIWDLSDHFPVRTHIK